MSISIVETRLATTADVEGIAVAHLNSILSIGARYYSPEIVDDWIAPINADRYVQMMASGEVFYITIGIVEGKTAVLGFSSHRVVNEKHRTAIFIRSIAARTGIGTKLFKLAETRAIEQGAERIHVNSSLGAVEFYQKLGFVTIGPSTFQLRSGRMMDCVSMQKTIQLPSVG